MFEVELYQGCLLRPFQLADVEFLYELTISNLEHLRKWLPWLKDDYSKRDTEVFIARSIMQFEQDKTFQAGLWVNKQLAGCVGLRDLRHADRCASVGYWLIPSYVGRGLMTRAMHAVMNYSFCTLRLNRLEIRCGADNHRSQAIPERLGFTREGTLREAEWLYDHFVDLVVYSLLADEYVRLVQHSRREVEITDEFTFETTWDMG